jgi:polyhydroxybutyrate depolymerase
MHHHVAPASARATTPVRARRRRVRGGLGLGLTVLLLVAAAACTRSGDESASSDEPAAAPSGDDGGDDSTAAPPAADVDPASVAADPSDGCDAAGPAAPGDQRVALAAGGAARGYLLHVPPGYDGTTPLPLVVDVHGYAIPADLEAGISGMAAAGDTAGYLTLTPEALGQPERWDTRVDSDDVAFVGQVLDDAEATLCVDRARVFATGFSEGGFMASTLACGLSDRIAAVAPVAGLRDVPGCAPDRPVPVLTFHGTEDTFMVYDGGMGPDMAALPAPDGSGGKLGDFVADDDSLIPGPVDDALPDIAGAWADRNGCEGEPEEAPVANDVTRITYACPPGADVELYRVRGGGHTWPGSDGTASFEYVAGTTTFSVDATELIWEFFTVHPLTAG